MARCALLPLVVLGVLLAVLQCPCPSAAAAVAAADAAGGERGATPEVPAPLVKTAAREDATATPPATPASATATAVPLPATAASAAAVILPEAAATGVHTADRPETMEFYNTSFLAGAYARPLSGLT